MGKLFQEFSQASASTASKYGGTGLGLAIVKHILNRHKGYLEIESHIGQGSVFTALLPQAV